MDNWRDVIAIHNVGDVDFVSESSNNNSLTKQALKSHSKRDALV